MNENQSNKNKGLVLAIVIVIIFIAVIFGIMRSISNKPVVETPSPGPVMTEVDLIGTYVCLPHRNTSGATTMECAFGLQVENGDYYALDMSAVTFPADSFNTGDKIRVTGKLTDKSFEQTNIWNTYNIVGGIRVVSINKMLAM